ncbi:ATP-binding protein, partial [Acidisphaera rubrifaciens]|uniref:ATP-binding protein n=1 Tax=Acidisphaera rubrifaciens TaxID=50715 RepID=UPI000662BB04
LALRRTQAAEAAAARALREVERREAAERVAREARKMEALGKLTGGIAHDFNNLLAVIMGNAELAMNRPPDRARRLLEGVIAAAQRGERLTRQFLAFSRSRPAAPRLIDLAETVPRVIEMVQPALGTDIQAETRLAAGIWPIRADPGELEIALLNLAINARDAMPRGGRLTVRALNVPAAHLPRFGGGGLAGDHVALSVADTGTGMPRNVLDRAFEPFFTTKEVGVGTGLGLSQVYGFARQSGGLATIDSTPGRGTVVTMLLPRAAAWAEPEPEPAAPAAAELPSVTEGRRVLVVEDNEEVAAVTAALLRAEACEVDTAARVAEARQLLEAGRTYDLVLADIVMPGDSGIDFAQEIRMRWPRQRIVLMTGFTNRAAEVPAGVQVVSKPLRLADFRRLLTEAPAAPTSSHT